MKTYEEFKTFCNTSLNNELNNQSDLRSKVVKKLIFFRALITLQVIGILALMGVFELLINIIEDNWFYTVVSVISLILYVVLIVFVYKHQRKIRNEFTYNFKLRIIKSIIEFFDKSLNYQPNNYIPFDQFEKSGLFPRRIDKYYGDDYVEGKLDKTNIKFSEIHVFVEENSSDNKKTLVEIFGGIFFIADFNKNFNGKTIVLPDKAERTLGKFANFFQSLMKQYGELVKLEDIEFEKEFMVYSNDQIESRFILSTSIMDRLTNFKRKVKKDIYISFVDNHIYLGIHYKGRLFEPKIFGKLVSEETLRVYYEQLELTLSIVDELNLNLRIWGKE